MEIYVKRIQKESGVGSSGNVRASTYEGQPEPYIPVAPVAPVAPNFEPDEPAFSHFSAPAPAPYPRHVAPLPLLAPAPYPRPAPAVHEMSSDFENIDTIPEVDLQTGDEYEGGNWDSDHLEGCDEAGGSVPINVQYMNPFNNRVETHPFDNFNDISEFREADIGYFGARVEYRDELAAEQYLKSKEALLKKVREHNVEKNKEIRMKKSDKSRIVVVCNTPGCDYELRTKPSGFGQSWVIIKQDKPHTYRSEFSRTDHQQLTASIATELLPPLLKVTRVLAFRGS